MYNLRVRSQVTVVSKENVSELVKHTLYSVSLFNISLEGCIINNDLNIDVISRER
jgi:hypothetical protein